MSLAAWAVVVIGTAATLAVALWFATTRQVPERAASHDTDGPREDESGRGQLSGDVVERPAGPGAESQRPDGRGPLRPGP